MNNGQTKPRVAIARICYGAFHHAAVGDWLARTCHVIVSCGQFSGLESFWVNKHNVCVARNFAVEIAKDRHCDYLLMVDADSVPDVIPDAPPFWDTSIAHALAAGPCVVAAPIERGDGEVVVYQEIEDDDGLHLKFIHEEIAVTATGIQLVPAVSLALSLIDMRCFDGLPLPYFRFGYNDDTQSVVAWTEEVFTANLTEKGIPVFVNWDCWCGHDKRQLRTKPVVKDVDAKGVSLWVPDDLNGG